ncbi:type II toxin-antitoxin system Phd/YefM family antitoxin [Lactobacillus sp. PV037]|uniref:type II toxin-antitoxin system Phd/YefM family antitoxin n=1 Tax=unclassified Lactobacillus TaxID=2620435 RepID=UPI00223FBD1B|nr:MULTISPECIES: type II toxin-antitoxin system Phd/YefM family antitoxin [unclassified Lactobacillus]QNQ82271.1 type II toxin-antitoxin system Phd/YefM family antitoxin [Lactobacillus sp. PV012]QNQ83618.1 type II toxin-antitoxin system Phd/YefM family antitoxin [Lactobacillus sp. PV037]
MTIKATTTSELRKNFKKLADDVSNYNDVIFITRPENKNVVLLSEKEYSSWQETNYLLSTSENRKALQKAITDKHSSKKLTPQEWYNRDEANLCD